MDPSQPKHDPHGVQRLLEILRRQQDSSSSSTSTPAAPPANPFTSSSPQEPFEHDAAARRRLYSTPSSRFNLSAPTEEPVFDPYSFNPFSSSNGPLSAPITHAPAASPPAAKPAKPRNLSTLTFSESLPILSTLSTNHSLLRRLKALRKEQHDLERRLSKEYAQFQATADKQYPNPKVRREEDEKRRKKMLSQWGELVKKQQEEMQRMGIPTFKAGGGRAEVERQKKVLGVLVEMMDEIGE